jgi:class 3 adenylate cyclase
MSERRLFRPTAWPIALKLSLLLLGVSLGPMGVTAALDIRQGRASAERAELEHLEMLAESTAGRLDQLVDDTRRVVSLVASDVEVTGYLAAEPDGRGGFLPSVYQSLAGVVRSSPDIATAFLLDARGRCLISTRSDEIGRDLTYREYYREAIREGRYVSEILTGSTTRQPGVYFSEAVRDKDRGTVGVAVVKLSGDAIAHMVEAVRPGGGGAFLVDSYGVIVSHTDRDLLYRSLATIPPEVQRLPAFEQRFTSVGVSRIEGLGLDGLARRMVGAPARGSASYLAPRTGERKIVGFSPLRTRTWTLGVFEPESTFLAPVVAITRRTQRNALLVGAAVTLIALILARTIVRPIRRLIDGSRALLRGDFAGARVDVGFEDEIGALSSAFNTMAAGLRERERELEIFGRLVSPEVREKLLRGQVDLGGETRWAAVLFSDIRGFSTLAETMDPQAVVALLNEYLTEMAEATAAYQGYINNFIGDAIVVIFGAPVPQPDAARRAVAAALAMRRALVSLNRQRAARGAPAIETGIGIAAGDMVAGQIGSPQRMLYTVVGDAVNVAARLEALTKEYPGKSVLITRTVAEALEGEDAPETELLGPIKLKGRSEPVDVFAVVVPEG